MALYKSFKVPVSKEIELRFEKAAKNLKTKLLSIDVEKLDVSPYSKKYFSDYQRKIDYSLQACSFILMHALNESNLNIEQAIIVDYGAGTGVLAMLAKEVGFKKVIYNDIYDISCKDASTIATKALVPANDYVCGDIVSVKNYFIQSNQSCDIIVSRNVIEHIYNLDHFFKELSGFSNKKLTLFFATTANIKNPLTVWYTQRIQRLAEFKVKTTKWSKERDTVKPYLLIRKEIIEKSFPNLKPNEIDDLAKETRGLIKEDMMKFVEAYLATGKKVKTKVSGYNTCDPNTGNWAEHLVEINKYEELYRLNKFDFKVVNGFYNTNYAQKWLNIITPIINLLIRIMGNKGIYLAPFIGLEGKSEEIN